MWKCLQSVDEQSVILDHANSTPLLRADSTGRSDGATDEEEFESPHASNGSLTLLQ